MKVAVVGSDMTDSEPLRWAAGYCDARGDELVAVVTWEHSQAESPPDWEDEQLAAIRKQAEKVMDATAEVIPHRLELRHGEPSDAIAEAARENSAATVVVGARGTGGFRHLGLGAVAHHLARTLLIPVVVVPAVGVRSRAARSSSDWTARLEMCQPSTGQ